MNGNNKSDPIFSQKKPWENNDNTVWLASTVSLLRNIEKFKFPAKLETDREKQIIALVSKQLLSSTLLKKPTLVNADEISPLQKQYLVEHFLTQQNLQQAHSGEAFIIDESGELLITLNIHDHIRLELMDVRGELENTLNRLIEIETGLGKTVTYSFSNKYGFLTSDFNQCGSALIVSVLLQVPALIHTGKVDATLEKLIDESLTVMGIQGNPTEIIGDILVVQNNFTLGVSEENIISNLRNLTTKMMVEENSTKNKIHHEESADVKDKVSRAYGILIHSYQIEAIEALNAISLIKLGVELGWLTGITIPEINKLFFNCRRGHLLHQYGYEIKHEEVSHKRAEFIHKNLKNVQLTI
jgi:protein arginine kinase